MGSCPFWGGRLKLADAVDHRLNSVNERHIEVEGPKDFFDLHNDDVASEITSASLSQLFLKLEDEPTELTPLS
jgi:hypothetical protein